MELGRAQIARSIARHGELEGLLSAEVPRSTQGPAWMRNQAGRAALPKNDASGWKSALAELQVGSLNRAKKESRLSVDLLARLAVTKVCAHGNEPAIPAGAGALPRTAEKLRQHAAAEGA